MLQPSAKEHRIVLGDVELFFFWCGDRWSHRIVVHGPEGTNSWRSVEGPEPANGDPAWPASPALVELSPVPSAAAVVGVGRAGKSHYSVSFTAKPADSFTAKPAGSLTAMPAGSLTAMPFLLVECACRIQEPPGWSGSTYEHDPYEHDGVAGRPGGPIRIPAGTPADAGSPLPRTVVLPRTVIWSYRVGPSGPVACQDHS